MRKSLYTAIFLVTILPQIAFASWWNPFSWGIFQSVFHSKKETIVIAPEVSSTKSTEVPFQAMASSSSSSTAPIVEESAVTLCNGQYYQKCPSGQLLVCPTDSKIDAYCSVPKAPQTRTTQTSEAVPKPVASPSTVDLKAQKLLQAENDKLKAENEAAKLKQAEADKGFLCGGKYFQISCSSGQKLQCQSTGEAVCVSDSDVLCNGKYWKQCPVGQIFMCPSSGNASCSAPKPTIDLNKAASNKAELISLQNQNIEAQKKLLEDSTKEVTRMNNIINQLAGYTGGEILTVARELTSSERDLFAAYQNVDTALIQYTESRKSDIERIDVAAFSDESQMVTLRNNINANILSSSQELNKRQSQKAKYNDTIIVSIPTLNLNP